MTSLLRPGDPGYSEFDNVARKYEAPKGIHPDVGVWAATDLNVELWSKQREVLRLLDFGEPKVAVPSCNDSGKSFLSSIAACRFIAKHRPGSARVITTAPVGDQVRGVLWNEINQRHAEAEALHKTSNGRIPKLPGRVNQTEWWIGNYQAGIGRKPSESGLAEKFAGYHAEWILIIIDEAGAAPNELWTGVDTLATNSGAQILAIGNPTDAQSEFARVCDGTHDSPGPANGWEVVRISAWSTPNFSGEKVSPKLQRVLLSQTWVDDKREKWGEDDGRWESRIEAKFPSESSLTTVRKADLLIALGGIDFGEEDKRYRRFEDVQLGVDIAASDTGDETVIRERRGKKIGRRWSCQSSDPDAISDTIVAAAIESQAITLHVDATGVGFGFLGDLRKRLPGIAVLPFVAAARASENAEEKGKKNEKASNEFVNRRAESYWKVREMTRKRELDMSDMEDVDKDGNLLSQKEVRNGDGQTITQLRSVRYMLKKGKIQLEAKDDVRKRIGRSPDDADALCLAVLPPNGSGAPAPATVKAMTKSRMKPRTGEGPQRIAPGTALGERIVSPRIPTGRPRRGRGVVHRP